MSNRILSSSLIYRFLIISHIAMISTEQISEAGEIVDSFIEDFDSRVL